MYRIDFLCSFVFGLGQEFGTLDSGISSRCNDLYWNLKWMFLLLIGPLMKQKAMFYNGTTSLIE